MENKNLIFVNEIFDYERHSVEGAHALGLNQWKGWWCSAGIRSIYIDFDGNVFRGTCSVGGWIGNINCVTGLWEGPRLTTRQEWVRCNLDVCSCGADMAVPKVKDYDLIKDFKIEDINKKLLHEVETIKNPNVVYSDATKDFKSVIWDLGRLCNFDCSYCSKNSHNNYDPVKNLKAMIAAYENLQNYWNKNDERLKFSIAGGEPTVYKDYLPFVKYLKEKNHIVMTTTNGSNSEKYYAELAEYSDICFSIHLKYAEKLGIDKFVKNVLAAAETTKQAHINNTVAKYNWIIVRIMLEPGKLETAKKVYSEFTEKLQGYNNIVITVDVVHNADGDHKIYEYSSEELEWLSELHG